MLFYVPMLFFLGKKRLHYFPESFITSYFVNVKGFKLSLSSFFIQITAKILQFLSRALNCLESFLQDLVMYWLWVGPTYSSFKGAVFFRASRNILSKAPCQILFCHCGNCKVYNIQNFYQFESGQVETFRQNINFFLVPTILPGQLYLDFNLPINNPFLCLLLKLSVLVQLSCLNHTHFKLLRNLSIMKCHKFVHYSSCEYQYF